MTDIAAINLAMIHHVATRLGDLVDSVVFLGGAATKLEAFNGRGKGDFMASHDMEDIIALVDGRNELVEEVAKAPEDLRTHLAVTFLDLLGNSLFLEALPGHLPGDAASQQRLPILESRMRRISDLV